MTQQFITRQSDTLLDAVTQRLSPVQCISRWQISSLQDTSQLDGKASHCATRWQATPDQPMTRCHSISPRSIPLRLAPFLDVSSIDPRFPYNPLGYASCIWIGYSASTNFFFTRYMSVFIPLTSTNRISPFAQNSAKSRM